MEEPMPVSASDEYGNPVAAELMPEDFKLGAKKISETRGSNGGGDRENTNSPENKQRRSFTEIQNERISRINLPEDRAVEDRLRLELGVVIREYDTQGLLNGIRTGVANLQNASADDFPNTMQTLSKINVDDYMRAIATKGDVDITNVDMDELETIITEYKDVAVLVMTHAYETALKNDDRARELKREIDLRSWNSVPVKPYSDAIIYVSNSKEKHKADDETGAGFESQLIDKIKRMKKEGAEATEWAKVILVGIDFAEKESEKEKKKSSKEEKPEYWESLERAIQEIPNDIGVVDRTSDLARFLKKEYPEGLKFKDRVTILFAARKHLNDRFVEMSRASGSLTKMGVSDEMPFEGISYKVQPINNEDFEILFHTDEYFPELRRLSVGERKELLPDLDEAACMWLDVGIKNGSIPEKLMTNEEIDIIYKILDNKAVLVAYYDEQLAQQQIDEPERDKKVLDIENMNIDSHWVNFESFAKPLMDQNILDKDDVITYAYIPTFDNSLNNAKAKAELRKRMSIALKSSKAEDLAYRLFTNTLTFEMLDRGRSNVQGSSEPRDIMWIERKRLFEIMKEREPGLEWTVHRYFVTRPDPEMVISEKDAVKSEKLNYRREMLAINAERGVIVEKPDAYEGEIASDFFHSVMIFSPDELKMGKSIRRNLATYVLNGDGSVKKGGFKDMPFLEMGDDAYTPGGYWGYTIAKGKQLATEMSSTTYKKAEEELTNSAWWNKKRDLFARMEHISPRLITIEYRMRGRELQNLLIQDGRFNEEEIKKISGFSRQADLDVISDVNLRREAIRIATDPRNNIAKNAKDKAEKARDSVIDEFRLVHALGVVWPGSIDASSDTSNALSSSTISPELLTKITKAISASRYLEGDFLNHFKLECEEMGFGKKMVGRRPRYRKKVNADLWN